MKRLAAIALLLVFLVNTMGYFIVFRCSRFLVRREMEARIKNGEFGSEVKILRIVNPESSEQFKLINKREFTWFGKMYDIVAKIRTGDTTVFYCIHDHREQKLLKNLSVFITHKAGNSQRFNSMLALLYNLVTQALILDSAKQGPAQATSFQYPSTDPAFRLICLSRPAPPPKIA